MKKQIFKIYLLLFVLLYSCHNSKRETNNANLTFERLKPINININNLKPLHLKNLFKSFSYTRLENRNDNMIGVINKIIFFQDRIFISDNNNKIFIFNKNGKLINVIYENGRGPGEYVAFKDISIDRTENELIIFEPVLYKFLYYDINGNFIRENRFEQSISKFYVTNDLIYIYSDNLPNYGNTIGLNDNLIITTKDMKYYSSFLPIQESKKGYGKYGIQPFSSYKNELSLLMPYTDTVYSIYPDTIIPRYYFEFGKSRVPYDVFKSVELNIPGRMRVIINKLNNFLKNGYAFLPKNFLETFSTIFFKFTYKGILSGFYSKTSETTYISKNFINDIDHIPYKPPLAATDSEFVSILEPADIIEHYKKIKDKYPAKELRTIKQLVDSITEFDNPILVFAKTKPF